MASCIHSFCLFLTIDACLSRCVGWPTFER
jgi:hypothetical protein